MGSTPKRSRSRSTSVMTVAGSGRAPGRNRRRLEDLVGAAQLTDLAFQLRDALLLSGGHPGPLTSVDLGLAGPAAQGLTVDAELVGDPRDHAVTLAGLLDRLQHHPHGPLMQLGRVAPLRGVGALVVCHDSILPSKRWSLHRTQGESVISATGLGQQGTKAETQRAPAWRTGAYSDGHVRLPGGAGGAPSRPRAWPRPRPAAVAAPAGWRHELGRTEPAAQRGRVVGGVAARPARGRAGHHWPVAGEPPRRLLNRHPRIPRWPLSFRPDAGEQVATVVVGVAAHGVLVGTEVDDLVESGVLTQVPGDELRTPAAQRPLHPGLVLLTGVEEQHSLCGAVEQLEELLWAGRVAAQHEVM